MLNLISQIDLGDALKTGRSTWDPNTFQVKDSVKDFFPAVSSFLNLLVPVAFILAGLIFFFLLVGGGFAIIASGGNAKNVEQGRNQIMTAVLGLIVIFAAYWIVQIVELITGVNIFNSTL